MAIRNALVRMVCFDDQGNAFLIRENIGNTWYIVEPYGKTDQAQIMALAQLRDNFKGFRSEIGYVNEKREQAARVAREAAGFRTGLPVVHEVSDAVAG